ncbi:MAG: alpha/beta fold hydrolase [Dehalococcoidia bacterium]
MPKIRIDKLIMYYEKHGAGDSLVLITGLGSNATIWFRQVPALSEHYQLLTFDNRGSGRTAKPQYEYRISEMAYDTRHLMDAVAMEPAHFITRYLGDYLALFNDLGRRPAEVVERAEAPALSAAAV